MHLDEETFNSWIKSIENSTTIQQYRNKVRKYIECYKDLRIEEGLNEEKLSEFIFNGNGKSLGKYNALLNFCNYIYINLLNNQDYRFPIKLSDVNEFDNNIEYKSKRKKYTTCYLDDDFDFKELFNEKYYNHLDNDIATTTIKAVISCALSIGIGTGELLRDYNNPSYLTVDDIKVIEENQVEIKIYNNINVDRIRIPEESSESIIKYINIRELVEEKVRIKKRSNEKDAFFIKLWDGYKLNVDSIICSGRKPADINELVSYMLKYICLKLNIEELSLNDMRANKVYHELVATKGSALNDIIKLHGYVPFVSDAYQRFVSKSKTRGYIGFDFFNKTSLSENDFETIDSEVIPETYMTLLEKKKRNRKIVKDLKILYGNRCQVCGETIDLGSGVKYSEVHHIQPIGKDHNGVDNKHNMIVLCPNHHKIFDLGILAIDPIDCCTLIHINSENILNDKPIVFKHLVSNISIRYHYEHIYLNLKKELRR